MKKRTLKYCTSLIAAGVISVGIFSNYANAAVDSRVLKGKDNNLYEFQMSELQEGFVAHKLFGPNTPAASLYKDYVDRQLNGATNYSFHDSINGYISYDSIRNEFLKDRVNFNLNKFTESENAEAIVVSDSNEVTTDNDNNIIVNPGSKGEFSVLSID